MNWLIVISCFVEVDCWFESLLVKLVCRNSWLSFCDCVFSSWLLCFLVSYLLGSVIGNKLESYCFV